MPLHPSTPRTRRVARWLVPLAVVSLAVTGCGSDDADTASDTTIAASPTPAPDSSTDTTAEPEGDTAGKEEFCAIAEELNSGDGPPTVEMVERYLAAVPEEGKADTTTILDALKAAEGNFPAVLGDAEAGKAMEALAELESKVCGAEAGPEQDPAVQEIDEAATRVDLTMADFEFAGDLPTAAGRYSFVFSNEGDQPHLAALVRLEDGFTMADVLASQGEEGVAESFESSVAPPDAEAVITADLTPGEWTLVCPIPDAEGTSHFEHGMVTTFTVS